MTLAQREEHTTKVHVLPTGEIWYATWTETPQRFAGSVEDFTQRCHDRRGVIRILGTRASAFFLAHAYAAHSKLRVELASPRICRSSQERADPHMAIYRMRQCQLPASLGGWHSMTAQDYATYRLIDQANRNDQAELLKATIAHPLWSAISFIPTATAQALAPVITHIIDPRWHIDPRHPSRLSRLRRHLGLTPWTQKQLQVGAQTETEQSYCDVVRLWHPHGDVDANSALIERSNYFLWRVFRKAGGGRRGELVASQYLVTFLRHAWLELLSPLRAGQDPLFLPEVFFKTRDELCAYQAHRDRQLKTI